MLVRAETGEYINTRAISQIKVIWSFDERAYHVMAFLRYFLHTLASFQAEADAERLRDRLVEAIHFQSGSGCHYSPENVDAYEVLYWSTETWMVTARCDQTPIPLGWYGTRKDARLGLEQVLEETGEPIRGAMLRMRDRGRFSFF